MMIISPFQALTILAKKYRNASPHSEEAHLFLQIENLFLVGIQSEQDFVQLVKLLNDESLLSYEVALSDKEVINNDPVRRYFESILAHETLKTTIDSVDMNVLNRYFNAVYAEMSLNLRFFIPFTIYSGSMDSKLTRASSTAPEYIAAIKKLHDPQNFLSLKPTPEEMQGLDKTSEEKLYERMDKMRIIVKTVHAAMRAVNSNEKKDFPLNLYESQDSPYSPERRGRRARKDDSDLPQVVRSFNLGIMRSYHPLAQDDPLYEDPHAPTSGLYRRASDHSTYIPGAQMTEKFFSNQISPFVNSISGTMLCQLRVMAKLLEKDKLEFSSHPDQLKAFFKSMVSYMIYNSGGHSFQEFMSVFDLQEVKEMFKNVQIFEQINLRTIFQSENALAFRSSMNLVIDYNDLILARREFQKELLEQDKNEVTLHASCGLSSVK